MPLPSSLPFSLIVAHDNKRGIGLAGELAWRFKKDMQYFKHITTTTHNEDETLQNAVIMGRVTWESIPKKFRPLPRRLNIVVSRNTDYGLNLPVEAPLAKSLEDALKIASVNNAQHVFVIGGAQIYTQAIEHPDCHRLYITKINATYGCDAFFPEYNNFTQVTPEANSLESSQVIEENNISYAFEVYERKT